MMGLPDGELLKYFGNFSFKVRWNGLTSDTVILIHNGWRMFAKNYFDDRSFEPGYQIVLTCPKNNYIMSGSFNIPRYHMNNNDFWNEIQKIAKDGLDMKFYQKIDKMVTFHADLRKDHFENLLEVASVNSDPESIAASGLFKYKEPEKIEVIKEVFIRYETIDECLDRALEIQYPEVKEHNATLAVQKALENVEVEQPEMGKIYAIKR